MQIVQKKSPNFAKGRQGRTPDIIVCHITEGAFDGAVSWLTNPASQVSSHFVVAQDGRVTQLVAIEDTAWANGTTTGTDSRGNRHSRLQAVRDRNVNANSYTISIEHEGKFSQTGGALTPEQQKATTELMRHIRNEVKRIYSFEIPVTRDNIVGHADIVPLWKPNCPGFRFPFDEILTALQEKTLLQSPNDWARFAWQWGIESRLTDGTNPQGIPTREQMLQLLYNYNNFINSSSS